MHGIFCLYFYKINESTLRLGGGNSLKLGQSSLKNVCVCNKWKEKPSLGYWEGNNLPDGHRKILSLKLLHSSGSLRCLNSYTHPDDNAWRNHSELQKEKDLRDVPKHAKYRLILVMLSTSAIKVSLKYSVFKISRYFLTVEQEMMRQCPGGFKGKLLKLSLRGSSMTYCCWHSTVIT